MHPELKAIADDLETAALALERAHARADALADYFSQKDPDNAHRYEFAQEIANQAKHHAGHVADLESDVRRFQMD